MSEATYSVQVGWAATASDAFVFDSSTLDGGDALAGQFYTDFGGTYDDVTAYTRSVTTRRGRDSQVDAVQAGDCTIVLADPPTALGLFNPRNGSSPLAGMILPMRPVRVRATFGGTTYGLFYGFIDEVEYDPATYEATISALDLFVWLGRVEPTIAATGATTVGGAIGRILDAVGWTLAGMRDLDDGDAIADFTADGSKSALALIGELMEADRGLFYVTRDGVARYENRYRRARAASVATLSGSFTGARPGISLDRVRNRARVTAQGGTEQTATDADSQGTYGWADIPAITTPYLSTDAQAARLAAYLVALYRDPRAPVRGLAMVANRDDATMVACLDRELTSVVTVTEPRGGTSGEYHTEGVAHEITDGGRVHRTTLTLSYRDTSSAVFLLDSSTLDGGDVLVY